MRGRIVALACLSALLGGGAVLAADTVEGYVVRGDSGARVPGVEVAFYVDQGSGPQEMLRKATDAQGSFAFAGPFLTSGTTFLLAAVYQGVPHFSEPLQVGGQRAVILEVFEPTTDDSAIRLASHTLFLGVRGQTVDVAHLVQVENTGDHTYAGAEVADQRRVSRFVLPDGLFGLQSHNGDLVDAGDGVFYDTQPLVPGQTQVTFSYTLDARELKEGYVHEVSYPTQRLDVLLQPASFVPGPPFEDLGVVDLRGTQYRRLRVADLQRGQRLLVPLPLTRSLRWSVKWIALGAAAGCGALVLVLPRHGGPPPAPAAADPVARHRRREELLLELARLDDAHVGREGDAAYRAERARLLDEAVEVSGLMEGQDGGQ